MCRKLNAPSYVQWEVTPKCNYCCIHCYNSWRKNEDLCNEEGKKVNFELVTKKIIESKVQRVTITGGEPLFEYEKLIPCIKELVKSRISVSINTNASLVTDNMSKNLKELGIDSILVSLTANTKEKCAFITKNVNSFDMTMRGIENLIKYNHNVSINMVVTTKNLFDIYDTAKLFREIPIRMFAATKAATPTKYEEFDQYRINKSQLEHMFNELLRVKKDFGIPVKTLEFYPYCLFNNPDHYVNFGGKMCSAGRTEIVVAHDGSIKACPHSSDSYGYYTEGLKKAWDRMDKWRNDSNIPSQCKSCAYVQKCRGGCKMEAYIAYNDYKMPDPFSEPKNFIKSTHFLLLNKKSTIMDNKMSILPSVVLSKSAERKENQGMNCYASYCDNGCDTGCDYGCDCDGGGRW